VVPAAAQKKGEPGFDPYTQNKPELISKAGYVNWGDFMFGQHRTSSVTEKLGGMVIHWVETENFKIGVELPECAPPYLKWEKQRFGDEIGRLRKKLNKVPKKVKKLDPWLRVHLTAQRAEEEYQRFLSDFDIDPAQCEAELGGPWLGHQQKFMLLLVDKEDTLARYSGNYTGQSARIATHHHFKDADNFLFAISFEGFAEGDRVETDFYSSFAAGLYETFLHAYGRPYQLPWWYTQGLSSVRQREVSDRMDLYGNIKGHVTFEGWWLWRARVHAHVRWNLYRSFPECMVMTWESKEIDIVDYMMMWSWGGFLMDQEPAERRKFLDELKKPLGWHGDTPYEERVWENSIKAMETCFKTTPEQFEVAWKTWVMQKGPGKK
jgi:hypothetical protein